jgi:hypothetical protein
MKMEEVIIKDGRKDLITNYPVPSMQGESVDNINKPTYIKNFNKPLTVDLLEQQQQFFNSAK